MRRTKGVQYQYDGVSSHLGAMRRASSDFDIVRLYGNRRARLFPRKMCVTMFPIVRYWLAILTEQQLAIVGASHARLKIDHD